MIIGHSTAAKLTVTLPSAAANAGRYYVVKRQAGTHLVVIKPPAGETIDGTPNLSLNPVGDGRSLISDGVNWITIGQVQ